MSDGPPIGPPPGPVGGPTGPPHLPPLSTPHGRPEDAPPTPPSAAPGRAPVPGGGPLRLLLLVVSITAVIVAAVTAVAMLTGEDEPESLVTGFGGESAPAPVDEDAPEPETPTDPTPEIVPDEPAAVGPEPTPVPSEPAGQTCQNDLGNYRLDYPADWYAELDDPEWGCGLFDPLPIELIPETEIPAVAVAVFEIPGPYRENMRIVTEPVDDVIVGQFERDVGGRPAVCALLEATGAGFLDAGTEWMGCVVDWGADSLLVEATAWTGLDFKETIDVASSMLDTIEPITALPPVA
ncbi:MAG: hypothetical protein OEV40_12930 [Acidimicrobiia bacterium]|nr:hypothetical protein [Acidimicrobiia bacterium]